MVRCTGGLACCPSATGPTADLLGGRHHGPGCCTLGLAGSFHLSVGAAAAGAAGGGGLDPSPGSCRGAGCHRPVEGRSLATLPRAGFWAAHGELAEVEGGRREESAWAIFLFEFTFIFFVAYFLCFKQMHPLKCKKSPATPSFFGRLKLQVEGLQGRFNLGPCTSETLGHLGLSHGRVEPWQGAARRSVRPWSEGSREAEPSALLVMAWSQLVLRLGGLPSGNLT